jgi:hypothetical protein
VIEDINEISDAENPQSESFRKFEVWEKWYWFFLGEA